MSEENTQAKPQEQMVTYDEVLIIVKDQLANASRSMQEVDKLAGSMRSELNRLRDMVDHQAKEIVRIGLERAAMMKERDEALKALPKKSPARK